MNRETTKDLGLLLMRIMLAVVFIDHGHNGGMESPFTLGVMVAGLALVGPGLRTVTRLVPGRSGAAAEAAAAEAAR